MMKRSYLYVIVVIVVAVAAFILFAIAPKPMTTGAAVLRKAGQISFLSEGDIYLLDIDNGAITRLTQGARARWSYWSPDGEYLLFNRPEDERRPPDHVDLYLLHVSNGELKRLTDDGRADVVLWSPDGKLIAYPADNALHIIHVTGGLQRKLADATDSAIWSPDSKQIAFVAHDTSNPATTAFIAIINADGTNLRRYGEGTQPVWSPDGKQIAYADNSGLNHLMLMNADGSNVRTLQTLAGDVVVGEWSPDGKYLSFSESRPVGNATKVVISFPHVIGADGSNLVDIMKLRGEDPGYQSPLPSWSPDGKRLMFSASLDRICEFDVTRAKTQCWINGYAPHWSPDGKQVVFYRQSSLNRLDQICTASSPSDEKCYGENVKGKSNIQWRPS
jgi:Tol biopolymer transport system component